MTCLNPLGAWHAREANPDTGRFGVTFRMRDGWHDRPIDLPCGKCAGCLADKASGWAVRCYHESTMHKRNSFATLTYADPAPPELDKAHLQRFFKRLRARGIRFRYFACGEYGSLTGRPHYHVLFFGQDFLDGHQRAFDSKYYSNPLLTEAWGHGMVQLGACEPASVYYTTGYQLKDLSRPGTFHISSKRPYIGAGWLEKYHDDIVRNGFVTIDGQKRPVPRSYLLRPEFRFEFDALKEARRLQVENRTPDEVVAARDAARSREINLIARQRGALRSDRI